MKIEVNLEQFQQELESVSCGLAEKPIVEQSDCYIFRDGFVYTYNELVACVRPTCLDGLSAAIKAKELRSTVDKLTTDTVTLSYTDSKLSIRSGKRSVSVPLDTKLAIDLDVIEEPEEWLSLHEDFPAAIEEVRHCAGKSLDKPQLMCLHITSDFVESSDNYQISRFDIETPVPEPLLVRADSIKWVTPLVVEEIGFSGSWVHFRNSDEVCLSCKTHAGEFKDYDEYYGNGGENLEFPKSVVESIKLANIFTEETLTLSLSEDHLLLEARSGGGVFRETFDSVRYQGRPIKFVLPPALLETVVSKYDQCLLDGVALRVNRGRFQYVTQVEEISD